MAAGPQLTTSGGAEPVLVWRYDQPRLVLSSASVGGGLGVRNWVVNIEVDADYQRTDLAEHVRSISQELDLVGDGVGLLTAARVAQYGRAQEGGVIACATVGLSMPTFAAAASEATPKSAPGTINVVLDMPVRCAPQMLVNLVMTLTEAKTQALTAAAIPGTGTASDAVAVTCPMTGPEELFGGPRSVWGQQAARVVYDAVVSRIRTKG